MQKLIKAGANLEFPYGSLFMCLFLEDDKPLHWAAANEDDDAASTIDALLENGAEVDSFNAVRLCANCDS